MVKTHGKLPCAKRNASVTGESLPSCNIPSLHQNIHTERVRHRMRSDNHAYYFAKQGGASGLGENSMGNSHGQGFITAKHAAPQAMAAKHSLISLLSDPNTENLRENATNRPTFRRKLERCLSADRVQAFACKTATSSAASERDI